VVEAVAVGEGVGLEEVVGDAVTLGLGTPAVCPPDRVSWTIAPITKAAAIAIAMNVRRLD
jgi:hypothetical protein